MNEQDTWKAFEQTGKIADYMNFKNTVSTDGEGLQSADNPDRRVDHQGTKSW